MRQRCLSPNHHKFHLYGGRGIIICERWADFTNFLADMGERPPGTTLDRIDSDGDYEATNCRWADAIIQSNNRDKRGPARVVNPGDRFGRLVVTGDADRRETNGGPLHVCQCDCGGSTVTSTGHLRSGHTRSCGCLPREAMSALGRASKGRPRPKRKP